MKVFIGAFIFLSLLVSCNGKQEDQSAVTEKKEDLVEIKNGIYTEWYPGKKKIKFQGGQDEKAQRNGKWVFYSESGNELSFTFYSSGLKDGFTVVKYPSGRIHYRGEYRNDTIVGLWTTYDENGKVSKEKDFGY
jgi:antitoxin component YwqK of YwqJK toxin-antitoxin module